MKPQAVIVALLLFFWPLLLLKTVMANEFAIPLQSDRSWYQESGNSDGITVFSRQKEGSRVREVMAESSIAATIDDVLKVISDYGNYAEFMPYVAKCEVLVERDDDVVVFQQLDFMPPISDRYYTIVLKTIPDPQQGGGVQVLWQLATDEQAEKKGRGLAVQINNGGWRLLPENSGKSTKLHYYVLTDPGGFLPAWVSNIANTIAVPKIIRAVRDRVAKARD